MTETLHSEIQIAAPQATVFAFLTDPDKILRWMGTSATIEPHPGGIYLLSMNDRQTARGQFTEVIPVHRLAYSFGWEGHDTVPPESGLIEIDLIEKDGGTLCAGSPIAACPTRRNVPITQRAGPIICAACRLPPPVAIPARTA